VLCDHLSLGGRSMWREGLRLARAWQQCQNAAFALIHRHWMLPSSSQPATFSSSSSSSSSSHQLQSNVQPSTNNGSSSNDSNSSSHTFSSKPSPIVCALACFWLDVHYCLVVHSRELRPATDAFLRVDKDELKFFARR